MTKFLKAGGIGAYLKPQNRRKNNPKLNVRASYAWQTKYDTTTFMRLIPCILVQDNQKRRTNEDLSGDNSKLLLLTRPGILS